MPLVLTSNDVNASDRYDWKDITGEQYHYPNGYRNMILSGTEFVYYRGIRRLEGGRGEAQYFGAGVVGEIWRDPMVLLDAPKNEWAWYCKVQDYVPFPVPVPAKVGGIFFEDIKQNMWRNGVRKLSDQIFERILAAAGISFLRKNDLRSAIPQLPNIHAIEIQETSESLIAPLLNSPSGASSPSTAGRARWSRNAKIAGDRSEEIVARYIQEKVPGVTAFRHVAVEGETPGWDMEYTDADGNFCAVEVKGSSGSAFVNFDLTDGELSAARRLGRKYWIYLVSDCFSSSPKLQRIQDPAAMLDSNVLTAKPIAWRICRSVGSRATQPIRNGTLCTARH